jgi:hypothetical protein
MQSYLAEANLLWDTCEDESTAPIVSQEVGP